MDIGRAAIVAVGDGVYHSLSEGSLGQFQSLLPAQPRNGRLLPLQQGAGHEVHHLEQVLDSRGVDANQAE